MSPDVQKMVELIRGLITRVMARTIEEENKRRVALFEKSFQDLTWYTMEGEDEMKRHKNTPNIHVAIKGTKRNKS